jgi:hypothetical protein
VTEALTTVVEADQPVAPICVVRWDPQGKCEAQADWLAHVVCDVCGPRTSPLCSRHAVLIDPHWRPINFTCRRDTGEIEILSLTEIR